MRVHNKAKSPVDRARTLNNLGNAYANLPEGNRGTNLRRAITCYGATLRVFTKDSSPATWAITQINLGNA